MDAYSGGAEMLMDDPGRPRELALTTDERLLAFTSSRDGPARVYVTPLAVADSAAPVQVGPMEAWMPRWRPGTRELYFVTARGLARTEITERDGAIEASPPQLQFSEDWHMSGDWGTGYDLFADGAFLTVEMAPWELSGAVRVVTGWGDDVRRRLDAAD